MKSPSKGGEAFVALPVQFSNLFLDDLKRLANLAA